ncbi:hypothetical protein F5X96DRAFT_675056 [Biscogniauxia mediterranea]|nr:hypothetical protein F5X96DRAFT_675056 [Biscogniauxia mediterranea]
MSANNDNAMTRFLFAILRQKNLKDIDWNKVAHDPILAQEITNGHAARMRYSRFRSAMLGLEPTRRNRTGPPKSRVTKSKKDPKGKKDENVKSEPVARSPTPPQPIESPAPKIKQENPQYPFNSRLTPGLTPGPMSTSPTLPNTPVIQPRLLTPCSDTDVFAPTPAMVSSPSDMFNSPNPFDFHTASCADHTNPAWQHGTTYSAFDAAFPFDHYGPTSCDHSHIHHGLTMPNQSIEGDAEHYVDVKHEEWDGYH